MIDRSLLDSGKVDRIDEIIREVQIKFQGFVLHCSTVIDVNENDSQPNQDLNSMIWKE